MKKLIPIELLKMIDPLIEKAQKSGLAKMIIHDSLLVRFIDADEYDKSDFYFNISKASPENKFTVYYKPFHAANNSQTQTHPIEIKEITSYLEAWLSILEEYRNHSSIYDNPDRHRENQFYKEARIEEEDANRVGFSYDKLLLLDQYFEDTSNYLLKIRDTYSEVKRKEIDEIIIDISDLREETPSLTKNEVIKRLSKLFTKSVKVGMSVLKAVYGKFKEKIVDKISETSVEMIADKANDIINAISGSA